LKKLDEIHWSFQMPPMPQPRIDVAVVFLISGDQRSTYENETFQ